MYDGVLYDSMIESVAASSLATLLCEEKIASWEGKSACVFVFFPTIPGRRKTKACPAIPAKRGISYVADFQVTRLDGTVFYVDIKGCETQVFKLKHRLMCHMYPDVVLHIVPRVEMLEPLACHATLLR